MFELKLVVNSFKFTAQHVQPAWQLAWTRKCTCLAWSRLVPLDNSNGERSEVATTTTDFHHFHRHSMIHTSYHFGIKEVKAEVKDEG